MKKAELALRLVLNELKEHIFLSENRRLKCERDRPEDSHGYVAAVEARTSFDIAVDCVNDVAETMQITLKSQD